MFGDQLGRQHDPRNTRKITEIAAILALGLQRVMLATVQSGICQHPEKKSSLHFSPGQSGDTARVWKEHGNE